MRLFRICFLLMTGSLLAAGLRAQENQAFSGALTGSDRNRDIYKSILRLQDRRSYTDKTALDAFQDSSAAVRWRAVLAYGSLQDSTVLSPLLERFSTEPDDEVGLAAAFAIGQVGMVLSKKAVEPLSHELIWDRIDRVDPARGDRMIDELGKFGTQRTLDDIALRFLTRVPVPHRDAIVVAIARFAIRGLTNDDAVKWLLTQATAPSGTDWRVMYALQRIGRSPYTITSLNDVLPIGRNNSDPLLKTYFAALLGKLKDDRVLDVLTQLAGYDPDWRVRVNAIKGLGNYQIASKDNILDILRSAFLSDNMYIAATAMSVVGNSGLKPGTSESGDKMLDAVRGVALNADNGFVWQIQAEALMAWAKLRGPAAVDDLHKASGSQRLLRAAVLRALGTTGSDLVLAELCSTVGSDDKLLVCAALDSLDAIGRAFRKTINVTSAIQAACVKALESEDIAVIATAAGLLGEKPYQSPEAGEKLAGVLGELSAPQDVEAMQAVCGALASYNTPKSIEALEKALRQPDATVMAAAASALQKLTGRRYPIEARVEPLYTDFDFDFLFSLPPRVLVRLETIRGDVDLELYRDEAPFTVMSFLKLATRRGFFRGKVFHRVVPNFVIQGGDPRGDGWGGPEYSLRSEFSPRTFETGTLGMASSGKDTEGSQFFICQSPQPHLDGKYTIFGKVLSGMDVVNKIQIDDHILDVKILP